MSSPEIKELQETVEAVMDSIDGMTRLLEQQNEINHRIGNTLDKIIDSIDVDADNARRVSNLEAMMLPVGRAN